jgi:Xaa-Pro aminopeptidase
MAIIKTNEEVNKLRRAAQLGSNCFEYICEYLQPGMTEMEIAQKVEEFFVKNGASALSFDTIVGSGVNSCQIHSTPTNRVIQPNDIILFDMGCVLDGYCSDMSRTVFLGKPSQKQRELYDLVYQTYCNAIQKIQVDMLASEADALGRDFIKKKGFDYAHALGHGVGTEVHEAPLLSPKSQDILKENMVFSIEPGIYLENEFGIRIEDVGVLTTHGMEMFSFPSETLTIIEK